MRISIKDGNKPAYQVDLSDFNKDVISFGRLDKNDIVLSSKYASRVHGTIYVEGSDYYMEDLGSTNGLSFKGNKFKKRVLKPGDVIIIRSKSGDEHHNVEITVLDDGAEPIYPISQPPKRKTGLIVGLSIAVVALIAAILVVIFVFNQRGAKTQQEAVEKYIEALVDGDVDAYLKVCYPKKFYKAYLNETGLAEEKFKTEIKKFKAFEVFDSVEEIDRVEIVREEDKMDKIANPERVIKNVYDADIEIQEIVNVYVKYLCLDGSDSKWYEAEDVLALYKTGGRWYVADQTLVDVLNQELEDLEKAFE